MRHAVVVREQRIRRVKVFHPFYVSTRGGLIFNDHALISLATGFFHHLNRQECVNEKEFPKTRLPAAQQGDFGDPGPIFLRKRRFKFPIF